MRRSRLVSAWCRLSVGLVLTAGVSFAQEAPRATAPNVVLVLIDDLGASDVGCYGNPAVETPNLDRFARQGMLFTDAYSAAPVCSPTRAAILTGKTPARLRITNHISRQRFVPDDATLLPAPMEDRLPLEEVTLAELLKDSGYDTAFIGKWHLAGNGRPEDRRFFPEHQGFDLNIAGAHDGGPWTFFAPYRIHNLVSRAEGEYLPYRLVDEAIAYMRWQTAPETAERRGKRPFFLALWHFTVHWPIEAPAALVEKYSAKVGRGVKKPEYAAMTEAMDIAFGRLLAALDELRLDESTLVVFTSDNGALLSVADTRPFRLGKGYLYEGGLRVPFVVRWPGVVSPGSRSSVPIVSTDLFPTILEAARVDLPAGRPLDGESLVPLLSGKGELTRDALYFHYPNYAWHRSNRLGGAIRAGRYKLIERFDDGSVELYDLESDVGETRDLAPSDPERAAALAKRLAAWRERVGAAMPTPAAR